MSRRQRGASLRRTATETLQRALSRMKCIDERGAEGEAHGTGARWGVGYHLTFRVIRHSTGKLPQSAAGESVGPWGRGSRKWLNWLGVVRASEGCRCRSAVGAIREFLQLLGVRCQWTHPKKLGGNTRLRLGRRTWSANHSSGSQIRNFPLGAAIHFCMPATADTTLPQLLHSAAIAIRACSTGSGTTASQINCVKRGSGVAPNTAFEPTSSPGPAQAPGKPG